MFLVFMFLPFVFMFLISFLIVPMKTLLACGFVLRKLIFLVIMRMANTSKFEQSFEDSKSAHANDEKNSDVVGSGCTRFIGLRKQVQQHFSEKSSTR